MRCLNKKVLEKTNFLSWLDKGYTGKDINIAVIDQNYKVETRHASELYSNRVEKRLYGSTEDIISNGSSTCSVLSILPEAKIYLLPPTSKSLEWILENDIDIVIMSINFNIEKSSPFIKMFDSLSKKIYNKNIFLLNSAGEERKEREGKITYPECSEYWMSVGSAIYNEDKKVFERSFYALSGNNDPDYWQTVKLMAPSHLTIIEPLEEPNQRIYKGTSCACPSAAIHIALIIEYYKEKFKKRPNIKTIEDVLKAYGEPICEEEECYKKGYGLLILPENPDDLLILPSFRNDSFLSKLMAKLLLRKEER